MSSALISRSPDLKRLRDEGFEIEIANGYVLVHVPYVDSEKRVQRGVLATELTMAGDVVDCPRDHTVHFSGTDPCHRDGTKITGIKAGDSNVMVRQGLVMKLHLSNKPLKPDPYKEPDFYVKMTRYIGILCPPAESIDPNAKAASFNPIDTKDDDSPFMYMDTASSRSGINVIGEKLKPLTVAIVGLGGTGSYILDLIAKAPLKEIRLFDDDRLYSHNAFRAPGVATLEELRQKPTKVAYYKERYSRLHKHVVANDVRIYEDNLALLDGCDFVFICVDSGTSRKVIAEYLVSKQIQFADVGMGIKLDESGSGLVGTVRVTTSTTTKSNHVLAGTRIPMDAPKEDDDYRFNVQIADLNALNAVLAVIKFKKVFGAYLDDWREHHSTYTLNTHLLTGDETPDA